MSLSAGRPVIDAPVAFLPVAQGVDLSRQAVFFLDRDPLEDLQALPELADLVAQALVLDLHLPLRLVVEGVSAAIGASHLRPHDRGDHDHCDDQNRRQLSPVHQALSSSAIWSRSRRASICAAVCTPLSVTMRSRTRMRSCSCCTCPRRRSFSRSLTGGSPLISRIERAGIPILYRTMLSTKSRSTSARTNSNAFI